MQILCPNCKADSVLLTIESVDYIQCPECGWFETQQDGSLTACEAPSIKLSVVDPPVEPEPVQADQGFTPEPAESKSEGDVSISPPPLKSPSDKPVVEDRDRDDEDEVTIRLKFED
jgi:Zn ribbon nucleic-acid-binding protein